MRIVGLGVALLLGTIAFPIGTLSGCIAPDESYCSSNEDCVRIGGASGDSLVCHPTHHVCLPASGTCFDDTYCLDIAASRCNLATNHCQPCQVGDASDDSCSRFTGKPVCGLGQSGATECVACALSSDCPASTPICDQQRCRPCERHSDCAGPLNCDDGSPCSDSLVCIMAGDLDDSLTGRCAKNGDSPAGRVVYVHSDLARCDNTGSGFDADHPLCDLDAAAPSLPTRPLVRVLAADDYALPTNTAVTAGQVIYIGAPVPSRGIEKSATLNFQRGLLSVQGQANVTLDGFELFQNGPSSPLIKCLGTGSPVPSLTVRNSLVRGGTHATDAMVGMAIDLQDCRARIQGNVIGVSSLTELNDPNHSAHSVGLRVQSNGVAGTSFIIENNVIAGNWDYALDLDGATSVGVRVSFNTIVGNVGAIRCPHTSANRVPIVSSILWDNAVGSQFEHLANCSFQQAVVGGSDTGTGLVNQEPNLGESFELRTNTQNSACCIDQAMRDATSPAFDIKGTPRPQGNGWDIGAYELSVAQ